MKHLGDITKINGAEVEPVNVIIGGSPCQDLSVAGKRAGLAGERSGLFMEQLRIIKEMRRADVKRGRTGNTIRPRFMVWENVPGAFSSNKGEDFGAVLQETIKVVCEKAPTVPIPKHGWPTAGCLTDVAGQWSVAWRVLDAQFWGVPQRRRRIALVADFGGLTAPEVLFERKGVRGYFEKGRTPWENFARDTKNGIGATVDKKNAVNESAYCLQGNGIDRSEKAGCNGKGWTENVSYTLNTMDRHAIASPSVPVGGEVTSERFSTVAGFKSNHTFGVNYEEDRAPTIVAGQADASVLVSAPTALAIENHPNDSRVKLCEDNVVQTLSSRMGTGGQHASYNAKTFVKVSRPKFKDDATTWKEGGIANTLNTFDTGETRCNEIVVCENRQ